MTFTEIQSTITEVAHGFKFLADKTEELEKLVDQNNTQTVATAFQAMVVKEAMMEQVVEVNSLLGDLYKLNNPEVIEQAVLAVNLAVAGKEEYLIVAGILTGGLDLGSILAGGMN